MTIVANGLVCMIDYNFDQPPPSLKCIPWDADHITFELIFHPNQPFPDAKPWVGIWLRNYFCTYLSGDDLFSTLETSRSFSNSNLRHLRHSSDSDCLRVPETLWSTSHSKPLPTVPNTTVCSLHSNPLSNTPSENCSETSSDSVPSDLNSAPTFLRNSPSRSGDKAAPMASDIKGRVIKVIHNIKGRGWSGSVGSAGRWPWS